MKKSFQIFLFLMAFQMEVRVRASGVSEVLSEPAHCVGVSAPCSFKVPATPWSTQQGKMKLTAGPGALLSEEVRGKEWKLMEGALWIRNAPSVKVSTSSASAEGSSGEYWVLTTKELVVFRNISSRLIVTFKDNTKLEIPRGFEVWAGNVDSDAKVQHGMVEPIRLKDHLKLWFTMYPGTKKQFLSEVQDLKDQWVDLVEQSGSIYQKVAEREIAAIEEKQRQKSEALKKKKEADSRLRAQFYKKVFEQ